MPATPLYGFPAPDVMTDADGPEQILALGQAVENLLSTGTVKMAGGVIEANTPTAANHVATRGYIDARFVIGPVAAAPPAGGLADGSLFFGV
jgi:hypothetical protein